jgi:hypothetical protein
MKRLVRALASSAGLFFVGGTAYSQSLLYKPAVAAEPKAAPEQSQNCNATIPFESFVGKKVVFLAKTTQFQRFGYQLWHFEREQYNSPTYQDLAGKIGTIISIDMSKGDALFKNVVVKLDDTGKLVTSRTLDNVIDDVVFMDDIDFAKSRYVGKTVWTKTNSARLNQDVEVFEGVRIRKFSPVKIIDVVPGTFKYDPADFVVETEGNRQVLIPSSVSVSNISADMIKMLQGTARLCGFDEKFSTDNPRLKYKWPDAVWNNIEMGRVVVGMTLDQVIMAKGDPKDFNETTTQNTYSAQLVYDNNVYVYINGKNIVTAVQE